MQPSTCCPSTTKMIFCDHIITKILDTRQAGNSRIQRTPPTERYVPDSHFGLSCPASSLRLSLPIPYHKSLKTFHKKRYKPTIEGFSPLNKIISWNGLDQIVYNQGRRHTKYVFKRKLSHGNNSLDSDISLYHGLCSSNSIMIYKSSHRRLFTPNPHSTYNPSSAIVLKNSVVQKLPMSSTNLGLFDLYLRT